MVLQGYSEERIYRGKNDETLCQFTLTYYYFNLRIQEKKMMNKNLKKYIAAFDYGDKTLIVLSAASGGINVISFKSVIRVLAGTVSTIFTL